jgi:hypothetical protein
MGGTPMPTRIQCHRYKGWRAHGAKIVTRASRWAIPLLCRGMTVRRRFGSLRHMLACGLNGSPTGWSRCGAKTWRARVAWMSAATRMCS